MKIVLHMLDQLGLKVQKHQFRSQMGLPLKNGCETIWYIIGDRWSNDESDSVFKIFRFFSDFLSLIVKNV
jgi:hypothetical protein